MQDTSQMKEQDRMTNDTMTETTETSATETETPAVDLSSYVLKAALYKKAVDLTREHNWCNAALEAAEAMGVRRPAAGVPAELPVGTIVGDTSQYAHMVYVKSEKGWESTNFQGFTNRGEMNAPDVVRQTITNENLAKLPFFIIHRPDGTYETELPAEETDPAKINLDDYVLKSVVLRVVLRYIRTYSGEEANVREALAELGVIIPGPIKAEELPVHAVIGSRGRYESHSAIKVGDDKWEATSWDAFNAQGQPTGNGRVRETWTDADVNRLKYYVMYNPNGEYGDADSNE